MPVPRPPLLFSALGLIALAASLPLAQTRAADRANAQEAQAMVKKAVEAVKKDGEEKTYKEISKAEGRFIDRDLYLVVIDKNGTCLASGSRSVPVGQNLLEIKDPDGKAIAKERLEIAKTHPSFWQSYKFLDPLTRRIFPKQAYCQAYQSAVICGGVYNAPQTPNAP